MEGGHMYTFHTHTLLRQNTDGYFARWEKNPAGKVRN